MNEIFRFVLLRSPQIKKESDSKIVPDSSSFITELERARKGSGNIKPREAVIGVAEKFLKEKDLKLNFEDKYLELFTLVESMGETNALDKIDESISEIFDKTSAKVIIEKGFMEDEESLIDFIHALKITNKKGDYNLKEMVESLKTIELIKNVASSTSQTSERALTQKDIMSKFNSSIELSSKVFPLPAPLEGYKIKEEEEVIESENSKKLKELSSRAELLEKSIEHLMQFQGDDFKEIEIKVPKVQILKETAIKSNIGKLEKSIQSFLSSQHQTLEGSTDKELEKIKDLLKDAKIEESFTSDNEVDMTTQLVQPLVLKDNRISNIDGQTIKVIDSYHLDLKSVPVPEVVSKLESEHQLVMKQLAFYQPEEVLKVIAVGNLSYQVASLPIIPFTFLPLQYTPTLPDSKGEIKSVGIGDLLVVKEQIKKYESGEVAHIENVLGGEFKERIHRKLDRNEDTYIFETESIVEEQQELSTAERFELRQETSKIISEEVSNKSGAGFSVSAGVKGGVGYSFYIDGSVNSYVDNASRSSNEEATRKATSFSKDITTKAASRISERKRNEQVSTIIREVEETNKHGIDNKQGTNLSGVYQWVNKVYEAQVYNYGKRMLFDIMVPEPSAYLRSAVNQNTPEGVALNPPLKFNLQPNELTETNFYYYVKHYNVIGVKPPPDRYITVSKTFNGKAGDESGGSMVQSAELQIPNGYKAISGYVVFTGTHWVNQKGVGITDVLVGRKFITTVKKNSGTHINLDGEVSSIPIAIGTFNRSTFAVNIEIKCQMTDKLLTQWKLETYDAIKQQYLYLKSEYDEQLTAAQIQAGVNINGRNPIENRKIERTEIKKQCLSIITNQHYDLFNSINIHPVPQMNIPEAIAEGKYIRFFEQAFEWEHMMSIYYPYFWSRKNKWLERVLIEDTDPLHAEFLKAGSARVVVAVSQNFEAAVSHFMETGQIPEDEDLLDVQSPLYKPIVDEIKERNSATGLDISQGEPWDVILPTTLVKLRPDDSLPVWEKDQDGTWSPKS